MQSRKILKQVLSRPGLVTAPGVYDMISARIADRLGFDVLYMTGYGVSASLGLPDAGLVSFTEMVERVAQICLGTKTPLICDADTGFGGLLNVERTVRGYEAAGAAAIQLEDQVFPKRCGHTPGRRVVPLEDMVRKIKVAVASRSSPDFLVVARTDARTNTRSRRGAPPRRSFRRAGADILFIESPESEEEMARIGRQFRCAAARQHGRRWAHADTPPRAAAGARLQDRDLPRHRFLATAKALEHVYGVLAKKGSSATLQNELYSFDKFCRLVGFEHVWEFEKRWPEN